MKFQIYSIVGGLILTLAASSGLGVSAKALLGASKEADNIAEHAMSLTKVSKSGLKELSEMAAVNFDGVRRQMVVHKLNSTETGGVINTLNLSQDGTVYRAAVKIPESGVPVSSITVDQGVFAKGGRLMVVRDFELPSGKIRVDETFEIANVNGQNLRRTVTTDLYTSKIKAYVTLVRGEQGALSVNMRIGDKQFERYLLRLPDGAKGDILHFQMSSSGSRMTVQTSHGQQFEFALHADPHSERVLTSRLVSVQPTRNGIKDFQAAVKIIPGRKSASATSGDVRGLEVQGSRAAQ